MLFGGQGRVGLAGQGLGGGPRASVPGGVGGRGTGPRDGTNFATCVVFLSFLTRLFVAFFEGCPVVGEGRPRVLVAGEGLDGSSKEAWLAVPKRGKSREGLTCLAVPQVGARARGGIQGLRLWKGRCVIFRKLEG